MTWFYCVFTIWKWYFFWNSLRSWSNFWICFGWIGTRSFGPGRIAVQGADGRPLRWSGSCRGAGSWDPWFALSLSSARGCRKHWLFCLCGASRGLLGATFFVDRRWQLRFLTTFRISVHSFAAQSMASPCPYWSLEPYRSSFQASILAVAGSWWTLRPAIAISTCSVIRDSLHSGYQMKALAILDVAEYFIIYITAASSCLTPFLA